MEKFECYNTEAWRAVAGDAIEGAELRGVVAVLFFNTTRFIADCVNSLRRHLPEGVAILALDNGSTENLASAVAQEIPDVLIIRIPENQGVAAGFNAAARYGFDRGARNVYLINDDTIVQPGFWEQCEGALTEHGPGLVASVPLDADSEHRVQSAGIDIDPRNARIEWRHRGLPYDDSVAGFRPCDAFVGVGFMIHREAWNRLGPFNERFGVFFEETDYCARAREHGLVVGVAGSSIIWHHGSGTMGFPSPRYLYYFFRNYLWFVQLHPPVRGSRTIARITVVKKALGMAYYYPVVRTSKTRWAAVYRGLWDGFFRQPSAGGIHAVY